MSKENVKVLPAIGFVEATKRGLKNLFNFNGRARRSEFLGYMSVIAVILVISVSIVLFSSFWSKPMGAIEKGEFTLHIVALFVIGIAPLLFSISSQVRRLHDVGKSGILPILTGALWLITLISFLVQLTYEFMSIHNNTIPNDWWLDVAAIFFCLFAMFALITLYFLIKDSGKASNRYGESPKYV